MNETVIFDLETSLDREAFARATHVPLTELSKINEALGDVFPKPIFHQVVAIGVLRARFAAGAWVVEALGEPHCGARSEKDLIAAFVGSLAANPPRLVTWNGSSFDLPVLRWRAMLHEIPAPAFAARKYFARYLDDAVDLCDVLSSFDGRSKVSLEQACRAFGIGGKPEGVDGGKVQEMVDAGRFADISAYCERDVVLTYLLWLRYELFCGRLPSGDYRRSLMNLLNYLGMTRITKPYLQNLAVSIDARIDREIYAISKEPQ